MGQPWANKKNINLNLIPYTKINSKQIITLNVKYKNYKTFFQKIWGPRAKQSSKTTSKAHTIKGKFGKLDFIKILNFCSAKDHVKTVKRWAIYWEKNFTNHMSDKGLVSGLYGELSKLIFFKFNQKMENMNKHFMEEDIQIANKHMKRYSTSLSSGNRKLKPH